MYFSRSYCCTLIAKVAGPLLSCVTWALFKLLVLLDTISQIHTRF